MTKSDIIKFIIKPIEDAGFRAFFVGGCVRDSLMNKEPHDYDICTDATPTQLHTVFKNFSEQNSEPYGVTMPIVNGELVEIATMRKDVTKGRHPKIEFTDCIQEDASRRDFTVNALYENDEGTVFDPTEKGKEDISKNLLRFVGKATERLLEDPLRAYRYVRFISQKGFESSLTLEEIEEIKKIITPDFYSEVSKERKLKELTGIFGGKFLSDRFDTVFYLMTELKIFDDLGISSIFEDMKNCHQTPKWHAEGAKVKKILK